MKSEAECEQSVRQRDIDRQSLKLACQRLLDFEMRDGGCKIGPPYMDAEDCARIEASLKQCALDFPGFGPAGIIPSNSFAPKPSVQRSAYERGLAALNQGDLDGAIVAFTDAIADNPKNSFAYIRRAAAYEKKGDNAAARADYHSVLKLVGDETYAEISAKIRQLEQTKK